MVVPLRSLVCLISFTLPSAGSIIAAGTLAISQGESVYPGNVMAGKSTEGVRLAFLLPAAGILCSIVGYFAVSTKQQGKGWDVQLGTLMWALEKGMYLAAALFAASAYAITVPLLGLDISIFYTVITGLLAGVLIGKITEYYTSFDFGPVMSIKDRGMTGPATVVIQGLGVGMISTVAPVGMLRIQF